MARIESFHPWKLWNNLIQEIIGQFIFKEKNGETANIVQMKEGLPSLYGFVRNVMLVFILNALNHFILKIIVPGA